MLTKNRLEAFSDGIFAIAMTLLVIEIRTPEVGEGETLASALWDQWPSYAAYLVSFTILGVMWLNHHRMFEQVQRCDGPLLALNLNLLLWTALLPFPTGVVAEYLREGGDDATTALALYGGLVLVVAFSFVALFAWITHDGRLLGELPPREVVKAARLRFSVGLLFYALAFAMSWVSAPVALSLHAVMALYYLFDQASVGGRVAPS